MKVKEQYFSELNNNAVLHEQYWLDQLLNHHYEPIGVFNHEKNLPVFQHKSFTFSLEEIGYLLNYRLSFPAVEPFTESQ